MSNWFRRFLGLILLVTTVGIATCQSLVKAQPNLIDSNKQAPLFENDQSFK